MNVIRWPSNLMRYFEVTLHTSLAWLYIRMGQIYFHCIKNRITLLSLIFDRISKMLSHISKSHNCTVINRILRQTKVGGREVSDAAAAEGHGLFAQQFYVCFNPPQTVVFLLEIFVNYLEKENN